MFLSCGNALGGRTNKLACCLLNSVSILRDKETGPCCRALETKVQAQETRVDNIYTDNSDVDVGF